MNDDPSAAEALRMVLAAHIMTAADIAQCSSNASLAKALGELAREAADAPPSRILDLGREAATKIDELRAKIRGR